MIVLQNKVSWQEDIKPTAYITALETMESYVQGIIKNNIPNKVWLTEHPDVYTKGTSAKENSLISNPYNIDIITTNRGGEYTYHGLGQRIIYPMLNLENSKDIHLYIITLEDWIISTLQDLNLDAFKKEGMIGIWVLSSSVEKKISAIGIRFKKWVAYHGISLNVSTNLHKFVGIVPCGIMGFGVTSLEELGKNVSYKELDNILRINFYKYFKVN